MAADIKPLKKYGQNFLRNESLAQRIVGALECSAGDTLLEIGAGEGILTEIVLQAGCAAVTAVEIDPRLAEHLRDKFGSRIEIIQADFLTLSLENRSSGKKLKILGNIPYYLTSDIIFKILRQSERLECAVLMLQKEVAERLVANPGSKSYGILSVFVNTRATVSLLFSAGRENFYPQPKVDSAVVRLDFTDRFLKNILNYELFSEIIYRSFGTRRKMLRNSLKGLMDRYGIRTVRSVDLEKRPEELSVAQFVALANEMTPGSADNQP